MQQKAIFWALFICMHDFFFINSGFPFFILDSFLPQKCPRFVRISRRPRHPWWGPSNRGMPNNGTFWTILYHETSSITIDQLAGWDTFDWLVRELVFGGKFKLPQLEPRSSSFSLFFTFFVLFCFVLSWFVFFRLVSGGFGWFRLVPRFSMYQRN